MDDVDDVLRDIVEEEIVHAKFNNDGSARFSLERDDIEKKFRVLSKAKAIDTSLFVERVIVEAHEKVYEEWEWAKKGAPESFDNVTIVHRPSSGRLEFIIEGDSLRDRLRELKMGGMETLRDIACRGIENAYVEFHNELQEKGVNAID